MFFNPTKNKGITASADTYLPSLENLSTVTDLYSYDYMEIFIPDNSAPKSLVFGSPNYFFDPNSTLDYRDGLLFGQGSSTQLTWTRQYTINPNNRLSNKSVILSNGGSFSYNGSSSARLITVTSNLSVPDGFGISLVLHYESLVIPSSWIGAVSTPTIRPILSTSTISQTNSYFTAAEVSCKIYSELGLQADYTEYSLHDLEGNSDNYEFRIFPKELFQDLEGEIFWIKDYKIELICPIYFPNSSTAATNVAIGYKSWVDLPDKSFSDNSLSYVQLARFIDIESNPIQRDYLDWLVGATKGFFDAEIFPGFSLGGILGIIVAVRVMLWILKMMAGG